jgi:hypothetical protein
VFGTCLVQLGSKTGFKTEFYARKCKKVFSLTCRTGMTVRHLGMGRAWSSGHRGTTMCLLSKTVCTLCEFETSFFWNFKVPNAPRRMRRGTRHLGLQDTCALHMAQASGVWRLAKESYILWLLSPLKAREFSPSKVETFPINTAFLIHNFSFRTRAVQEEGDSRSQRGFLSSPIFSRVCFYLFVFCLSYHV